MNKIKKSKRVKPHIETDAKKADKETCRACELHGCESCLLCSKSSLALIALAIIFIAINNTYTRYVAWLLLLAAFLVPLIKQLLAKK